MNIPLYNSPYLLGVALFGALVFLFIQNRKFFSARPLVKAVMGVGLGGFCLFTSPITLGFMATGFFISALGDYFLDFPDDKFFLPGLISFFAAHLAFLAYLWAYASWSAPICVVIGIFTLGYFLWLRPSLQKDLVIPVAAYSLVIALMGMTALTTTLTSILVPVGALLFIASDVVLAVERFKFKFPMDKTINWVLYASGQFALAIGVTSGLTLTLTTG